MRAHHPSIITLNRTVLLLQRQVRMPHDPMDRVLQLVLLILKNCLLLITFGLTVVRLANLDGHFELAFGDNVEIWIWHVLSHDFTALGAFHDFELVDGRPGQRLGPVCKERRSSHEGNLVVAELLYHAPQVQVVILVRDDEENAVLDAFDVRAARPCAVVYRHFAEDIALVLSGHFLHD